MTKNQTAKLIAFILFIVFVYYIRGAMVPIVAALALFYMLSPLALLVERLLPKKFPFARDISIITSFAVFILVVLAGIEYLIPSISGQFNGLVSEIPKYVSSAQDLITSTRKWYTGAGLPKQVNAAVFSSLQQAFNYFVSFIQGAVSGIIGLLSQFIGLVVIPVIVYYMMKERGKLVDGIMKLVPENLKLPLDAVIKRSDKVLKGYVSGQLVICLLVGGVTGAGLYFLGIEYYLVLGLIVAVTELIPVIGPLFGAIPAVLIALMVSPALAVNVIILNVIVQLIGAYMLAPKIMGDLLDLHPLTIILAVLILGSLIGVWGVFFAPPIVAILKIIYLELKKA